MKLKNQRNSNLEILRIISMVFIIAHHFAVHGMNSSEFIASNPNTYLIFFIGILGKIGVVLFILISAYFMVNSKFTLRKFLVLGGEVYFYSLLFLLLFSFVFVPATPLSVTEIGYSLLPLSHSAYWFVTGYIVLMLLSPFLNKLIHSMSKRTFLRLLLLLIIMWSIYPTFTPSFSDGPVGSIFTGYSFQYVPIIWFVVLYFIGAFIRLHVDVEKISFKKLFLAFSASMIITYAAACICGYYDIVLPNSSNLHLWIGFPLESINDGGLYMVPALENKFFVMIASVSLFLMFIKRKEFSNRYINYIAGSAFGVYLIHDNTLVRHNLWNPLLHTQSYYFSPNLFLIIIGTIILIYLVCTGIDIIRRETIEKLWIWFIDSKLTSLSDWLKDKLEWYEKYMDNYLKQ